MYIYALCVFEICSIAASYASCPINETEWKRRTLATVCTMKDYVYHCLKQDTNFTKELCLLGQFMEANECPLLVKGEIKRNPCNETNCPIQGFHTRDVYKYPVCFGDTNMFEPSTDNGLSTFGSRNSVAKTTSSIFNTSITRERHRATTPNTSAGGITGFIVVLNICLITFYCLRKRRRRQQMTVVNEPQAGSNAVMSQLYDLTNINPCNNTSTTRTCNNEATMVYDIRENEDIYNHLQNRRVILDQPILYDSD